MFRAWRELLQFSRGERAVLAALVLIIASGWGVGHWVVQAVEGPVWGKFGSALSNSVMAEAAVNVEADADADGGADAIADDADGAVASEPTAQSHGSDGGGVGCDPGQIDVNRALSFDLEMLPGIGAVKAERILAFREAHGPFQALADLLEVKGIGPATLSKLQPKACAGRVASPDV